MEIDVPLGKRLSGLSRLLPYTLALLAILLAWACWFSARELFNLYRISQWHATTAVVTLRGASGEGESPELWSPEIDFRYTINGDSFEVERKSVNLYWSITKGDFFDGDRFQFRWSDVRERPELYPKAVAESFYDSYPIGETFKVFYDPRQPAHAIMERGLTPAASLAKLALILGGSLLFLIGILVYAIRSRAHARHLEEETPTPLRTPLQHACRFLLHFLLLASVLAYAWVPAVSEIGNGPYRVNNGLVALFILKPWIVALIYICFWADFGVAMIYGFRLYSRRVYLYSPFIGLFLGWLTLVLRIPIGFYIVSVLVLGVLSALKYGNRFFSNGFLIAWLIVAPAACGTRVATNIAPWYSFGEVRTSDGAVYHFMDSSFLQGQRIVITRRSTANWLGERREVLGTTNGDFPRSYASIIRPADQAKDEYGQLYLSPDSWIIGVRYENNAYMAYDIANDSFYGHSDIEALSPFILIGANTRMWAKDVEMIMSVINERDSGVIAQDDFAHDLSVRPGIPRKEALIEALKHPNPEVVALAQKMLDRLPVPPPLPDSLPLVSLSADDIRAILVSDSLTPYGRSMGDWSAAWWRWALETPFDQNAVADHGGFNAASGQSGRVWYLAGTFSGMGKVLRHIVLPSDRAIFIPVVTMFADTATHPACRTPSDLKAIASAIIDHVDTMQVVLNGLSLPITRNNRCLAPVFQYDLPEDNVLAGFGYDTAGRPGRYTQVAADGYYLMLNPLPVGHHRLSIYAEGYADSANSISYPPFIIDVTYDITVK